MAGTGSSSVFSSPRGGLSSASTSTNASENRSRNNASSTSTSPSQSIFPCKTFQTYLFDCCIYSCVHCRVHVAKHDDLISKTFQGSHGRAYLFQKVVNVGRLAAEQRMLLTGLHFVADIYCEGCHTTLGWKYERAFEESQRYKEGKYIIEQAHLVKDNGWIDTSKADVHANDENQPTSATAAAPPQMLPFVNPCWSTGSISGRHYLALPSARQQRSSPVSPMGDYSTGSSDPQPVSSFSNVQMSWTTGNQGTRRQTRSSSSRPVASSSYSGVAVNLPPGPRAAAATFVFRGAASSSSSHCGGEKYELRRNHPSTATFTKAASSGTPTSSAAVVSGFKEGENSSLRPVKSIVPSSSQRPGPSSSAAVVGVESCSSSSSRHELTPVDLPTVSMTSLEVATSSNTNDHQHPQEDVTSTVRQIGSLVISPICPDPSSDNSPQERGPSANILPSTFNSRPTTSMTTSATVEMIEESSSRRHHRHHRHHHRSRHHRQTAEEGSGPTPQSSSSSQRPASESPGPPDMSHKLESEGQQHSAVVLRGPTQSQHRHPHHQHQRHTRPSSSTHITGADHTQV